MKLKERNHKIKERGKKREKEYLMKNVDIHIDTEYTDKERRKKTAINRVGIGRRRRTIGTGRRGTEKEEEQDEEQSKIGKRRKNRLGRRGRRRRTE